MTKLSVIKQPRDQRFIQILLTIIYLNRCEAVNRSVQQIDFFLENVQSNLFNLNEMRKKFSAICRTNEKWSEQPVTISIVALTRLKTINKIDDCKTQRSAIERRFVCL